MNERQVNFRIFDSFGNPLINETPISDSNISGSGIDVASLANGDFIIAWSEDKGDANSDVYGMYFRHNGTAIGSMTRLDEDLACADEERPRIALWNYDDPDEGYAKGAICWTSLDSHGIRLS